MRWSGPWRARPRSSRSPPCRRKVAAGVVREAFERRLPARARGRRAGARRGRAARCRGRACDRRARPPDDRDRRAPAEPGRLRSRRRCGGARAASPSTSRARPSRCASARALHCAACDIGYGDPSPALFSFNNPVGRLRDLQGLRPHDGHRPRARGPGSAADARAAARSSRSRPKFYSECQDDLERFLKRAGLPEDVPWPSCPRRGEAPRLGRRAGRPPAWRRKWYGVTGFFEWLESAPTACTCACSCPATAATAVPRLLRRAAAGRRRGSSGSTGARCPTSRRCRWPKPSGAARGDGCSAGEPLDPAPSMLLQEIRARLRFLVDVGLGYLTSARSRARSRAARPSASQLATALGGSLTSTLYVLDEPSVGLHPRDVAPAHACCGGWPRPATPWWSSSTTRASSAAPTT